jgi:hypothetical protein
MVQMHFLQSPKTLYKKNEKIIKNDKEKVKLYHRSDTKLVNDSLHVEPKDIKTDASHQAGVLISSY